MSDTKIGRVAFRLEGNWVNAYWAQPSSMDGAILLGSIRREPCKSHGELFEDFKRLMVSVANISVSKVLGEDVKADWEEVAAPEHERAGNA